MILDDDLLDRGQIADNERLPLGEIERDKVAVPSRRFGKETQRIVAEREQISNERQAARARRPTPRITPPTLC
jgi:hypothetical protein